MLWSGATEAQSCERSCAPRLRDAHGCCPAAATSVRVLPVSPVPVECQGGKVTTTETAGHCCWPGQTWAAATNACAGAARCPAGLEGEGETCVSPDKDGDGIPNVRDRCPSEPEDLNAFEDADGCPDEARRVAVEQERIRATAEADARSRGIELEQAARAQWAIQKERDWERAASSMRLRRQVGLVAAGVGLLAGAGSFVFMGLGAGENGSIRSGSLATGSDIASAASTGSTDNVVAVVLGVAAILGCGAGVPLFLTALSPPDRPNATAPSVSVVSAPGGGGAMATVRFE
jgi:hypothetical protein